jgi:hypothetical protein
MLNWMNPILIVWLSLFKEITVLNLLISMAVGVVLWEVIVKKIVAKIWEKWGI